MSEPNQTVQPDEMGEQQLSELLQIRRDKLQALREAGRDPFTVTLWEPVSYTHLDVYKRQCKSVAYSP